MKRRIIIIHGAHRSGTSFLTSLLNQNFNFDLGNNLLKAGEDNQEGFFENIGVVNLNDQFLSSQNLDWFSAAHFDTKLIEHNLLNKIHEVMDSEYQGDQDILIKDPRMCFTLPLWMEALSSKFDIFHIPLIRNIESTARSLFSRNNINLFEASIFTIDQQRQICTNLLSYENVYWTSFEKIKQDAHTFITDIYDAFPFLKKSYEENPISTFNKDLDHSGQTFHTIIGKTTNIFLQELNSANLSSYFEKINGIEKIDLIDFKNLAERVELSRSSDLIATLSKKISKELNLLELLKQKNEKIRVLEDQVVELNDQLLQAKNLWEKYQAEIFDLKNELQKRGIINSTKFIIKKLLRIVYKLLPLPISIKSKLRARFLYFLRFFAPVISSRSKTKAPSHDISYINDLSFPSFKNPIVSIVIPVYNKINYTAKCIESLYLMKCSYQFEIIVADDNPDSKFDFSTISGIRYIKNKKNLGFLNNCNNAAKHASGKFITFLNNDTIVSDFWLDELVNALVNDQDAVISGSMIINEDGSLQEAGGIIFDDGTGWNWGRDQKPSASIYNFIREVDYVSGCSICIKKEFFDNVGGFSNNLDIAYYEDTYICFLAREHGFKVIFNPFSRLVHYEGISHGTDISLGIKKYQESNREIFLERFKSSLLSHKETSNKYLNSDRYPKEHLLIIDETTPHPDEDSGSNDMVNLIRVLQENNYRVHFFPLSNQAFDGSYTENLQKMGVNCLYHPDFKNINDIKEFFGDIFSKIVISRFSAAKAIMDVVKKSFPSSKIIFNTVDLHFLREEREAKVQGRKFSAARKLAEIDFCNQSDKTIVISAAEKEILNDHGVSNVEILPLLREPTVFNDFSLSEKNSILFIGGFNHPPNLDGITWFIKDVWPLIADKCSARGIKLKIIGSHMPESLYELSNENIDLIGYVEDIEPLFRNALFSIAPLRYGAGLKGKVATSFSYGIPVIGTTIAFEGMKKNQSINFDNYTANSHTDFAKVISHFLENPHLLVDQSFQFHQYFQENFTYKAHESTILEIFS